MIIEDARKLKQGQVVYFCDDNYGTIKVGILESDPDTDLQNSAMLYIGLLSLKEHRVVSSEYVVPTPIDDFRTEEVWHDLPKDWSYDTELFRIDNDVPEEEQKRREELLLSKPEDVYTGLKEGIIVPASKIYGGEVTAEIQGGKWRIRKSYSEWTLHYGNQKKDYEWIDYHDAFLVMERCLERNDEIRIQRQKIADMTDREWSIYEIERTLKKLPPEKAQRYRDMLLSLPDIEDVEVRKKGNTVEWRYFRKSDWTKLDWTESTNVAE